MIDLKVIHQDKDSYECAVCCMDMLLRKFKKPKDRETIKQGLFYRKGFGIYIMDFEACLMKYGFDFEPLKSGRWSIKIEKMREALSNNNAVVMKIKDRFKGDPRKYIHFTICTGANGENLYFADPYPFVGRTTTARGHLERKIQDFYSMHYGHPQQSSWIIKG